MVNGTVHRVLNLHVEDVRLLILVVRIIWKSYNLKVTAIAALTQSGNAAQWLSRADAEVPIYALSPDKFARRKLTLHRGVYPFPIEQEGKNKEEILQEMEQVLLKQSVVNAGDLVLLTFGEPIGHPGGTNTLKIIKIGENRAPL